MFVISNNVNRDWKDYAVNKTNRHYQYRLIELTRGKEEEEEKIRLTTKS